MSYRQGWFVLLLLPACFVCLHGQVTDASLADAGLVDVGQMDTSLRVEMMYARPDNFMGKVLYAGITKAWLRPEAAHMLADAQKALQAEYPGRRLIVYDAARPMSVQRRMWAVAVKTGKTNYVSNPSKGGGLHNYAMAVDVSVLDESGRPLDMGTPVDFLGKEAHTDQEAVLVRAGLITRDACDNRQLLRRIMRKAGFTSIRYEWWHFNACSRETAKARYPLIY